MRKAKHGGRKNAGQLEPVQYQIYHMNETEMVKCLLRGCVVIGVVSYLFYYSYISFFCMLPYLYLCVRKEKTRLKKERLRVLKKEFKEGIQALQAALDAGYSVENAFEEACKDLQMLYPQGSYITREFRRIVQGIHMNKNLEEMIADFGERSGLEEIMNFAEIVAIAKRSGGDMILIIQSTVQTIREKLQVQAEIETMLSGKKFEQKIMSMIPFAILLYVRLTSDGLLDVMYGNVVGIVVMTGCLGVYLFATMLAERIVQVEV